MNRLSDALPAARRGACLLVALALLSGCADVREMMGFSREGPDEFAVVTHQPLVIPPDFRLRPPRPGEVVEEQAQVQAQEEARETAEEVLFSRPGAAESSAAPAPTETESGEGLTSGEAALLEEIERSALGGATAGSDQTAQAEAAPAPAPAAPAPEAPAPADGEQAAAAQGDSDRSLLDRFWDLF